MGRQTLQALVDREFRKKFERELSFSRVARSCT
jgi:hypothetical protein